MRLKKPHAITLARAGTDVELQAVPGLLQFERTLTVDVLWSEVQGRISWTSSREGVARMRWAKLMPAFLMVSVFVQHPTGEPVNGLRAEFPIGLQKNLPLAPIRVNGSEALTFILDSAAAHCVLDRKQAAALGLNVAGKAESSGSGGSVLVDLVHDVRLDLNGIEIIPQRVLAFDMEQLSFTRPVDGILGLPLFSKYVVEIDYPGRKARIFDPDRYRPPEPGEVIPIRMTTGPTVRGKLQVRGRAPIEADFQIDTGSAQVLTLCTPLVKNYRLLEAAEDLHPGQTLGFGGETADMAGRIEAVSVGRFSVGNPEVRFSRSSVGSFATDENYSGNLGGDFLRRYVVTFDIPHSRLVLESPRP